MSDAGAVVKLLVSTGRAAQHRGNIALEESGLRMRQVAALRELAGGPMSQQALAETLRIDPTKLVGLLNELEAEGFVERRRDPTDRRRHHVEATADGIAALASAMQVVERFEEDAVAGIAAEDLPAVRAALTAVARALDARPGCGGPEEHAAATRPASGALA